MRNQATSNCRVFDFAQFECERRGNVFLFDLGLTDIELPSLTIMVGKRLRANAELRSFFRRRIGFETAIRRFTGAAQLSRPTNWVRSSRESWD